jgi:hypothetical protein
MDVSADSFGSWLRELPLAAPKTPVLSTRGAELFPGEHDYVAGVIAIDTGKTDVQQSSEAVTRLHAEWMFARGRRDLSYLAATKDELPYDKWTRGMRVTAAGAKVFWVKKTKASDPNDRAELRAYLDTVFAWGNSASVRLQSDPVEADKLAPGDFFLKNDKSGHAVIVLDIAKKPTGERVALLGHALPSASSLYVLRLGPSTPWFSVRPPEAMLVPHAPKLEWSELRRLRDAPKPEKR